VVACARPTPSSRLSAPSTRPSRLSVLRGASCADVRWRASSCVCSVTLFVVAADLVANPHHRGRLVPRTSLVVTDMVHDLEDDIDRLTAEHPLRAVFVVPGATPASAALDVARAVVRRAERRVVEMDYQAAERNPLVRTYLNRLSDLLYVLARSAAVDAEELPSDE
jgi:cob(I)alamin adenosyltransferase